MENINKEIQNIKKRLKELEKLVFKRKNNKKSQNNIRKVSINEFLEGIDLKTYKEKILAIAYYMDKYENKRSFSVADLKEAFRRARLSKPSNFNDQINKLIEARNRSKGSLLMEDGENEKGHRNWSLTRAGLNFMKDKFNNNNN